MNEKLQKVLENILENEQEADKFAKFETVDEMYSYFKKEIPDLDEKEFNDFIDEILEWYENNEESIQKLQEDSLDNISGGVGLVKRATTGFLSLVSLLSGIGMVQNASAKNNIQNHAVTSIQKQKLEKPKPKPKPAPKPAATPAAPDAKPKFDISRYLKNPEKSPAKSDQPQKQTGGKGIKKAMLTVGTMVLLAFAAHKAGLTGYVNEKYGITDKLNSLMDKDQPPKNITEYRLTDKNGAKPQPQKNTTGYSKKEKKEMEEAKIQKLPKEQRKIIEKAKEAKKEGETPPTPSWAQGPTDGTGPDWLKAFKVGPKE